MIVGFAHYYNCPVIGMSTIGLTPWVLDYSGAAAPMSFVPSAMLPYKDRMTFPERVRNILTTLYERYRTNTRYLPEQVGSLFDEFQT